MLLSPGYDHHRLNVSSHCWHKARSYISQNPFFYIAPDLEAKREQRMLFLGSHGNQISGFSDWSMSPSWWCRLGLWQTLSVNLETNSFSVNHPLWYHRRMSSMTVLPSLWLQPSWPSILPILLKSPSSYIIFHYPCNSWRGCDSMAKCGLIYRELPIWLKCFFSYSSEASMGM